MFTGRSRQALVAIACAIAVRTRLFAWQASNALLSVHPCSNDPIELVCAAVSVGLVKLGERVYALASTYHLSRAANVTCTHETDAYRATSTTRAPSAF